MFALQSWALSFRTIIRSVCKTSPVAPPEVHPSMLLAPPMPQVFEQIKAQEATKQAELKAKEAEFKAEAEKASIVSDGALWGWHWFGEGSFAAHVEPVFSAEPLRTVAAAIDLAPTLLFGTRAPPP